MTDCSFAIDRVIDRDRSNDQVIDQSIDQNEICSCEMGRMKIFDVNMPNGKCSYAQVSVK